MPLVSIHSTLSCQFVILHTGISVCNFALKKPVESACVIQIWKVVSGSYNSIARSKLYSVLYPSTH